jgi:16S rRNA C1402 N4-methylase RsmH
MLLLARGGRRGALPRFRGFGHERLCRHLCVMRRAVIGARRVLLGGARPLVVNLSTSSTPGVAAEVWAKSAAIAHRHPDTNTAPATHHVPVMSQEVLQSIASACLSCSDGAIPVVVDATAGLGGHSQALLEALPDVRVLAIDRDPLMAAEAQRRLSRFGDRVAVVNGSYAFLTEHLEAALRAWPAHTEVRAVLFDLGVSSPQFDDDSNTRGFSFRRHGPLDMRVGVSEPASGVPNDDPAWFVTRGAALTDDQLPTAADYVNRLARPQLTELFREIGELSAGQSDAIARAIVQWRGSGRQRRRIASTTELRFVVERCVALFTGEPPRLASRVRAENDKGMFSAARVWHSRADRERDLRETLLRRPRGTVLRCLQGVWQSLRVAVNEQPAHLRAGLSAAASVLRNCPVEGAALVAIAFERGESRYLEALHAADCGGEESWRELWQVEGGRVGAEDAREAKDELDELLEWSSSMSDDVEDHMSASRTSDDVEDRTSAAVPSASLLTPPIGLRATRAEVGENPRARSARLFAIEYSGSPCPSAVEGDGHVQLARRSYPSTPFPWPRTRLARGGPGSGKLLSLLRGAEERRRSTRLESRESLEGQMQAKREAELQDDLLSPQERRPPPGTDRLMLRMRSEEPELEHLRKSLGRRGSDPAVTGGEKVLGVFGDVVIRAVDDDSGGDLFQLQESEEPLGFMSDGDASGNVGRHDQSTPASGNVGRHDQSTPASGNVGRHDQSTPASGNVGRHDVSTLEGVEEMWDRTVRERR